ncbi:MAG: hypothetical protein KGJ13_04330 [Patescibacteria group bacterium]|nr:hypothetical protein [Patescibacteria group bacterium]
MITNFIPVSYETSVQRSTLHGKGLRPKSSTNGHNEAVTLLVTQSAQCPKTDNAGKRQLQG